MQDTLSQKAYDYLRRKLSRGELPPGTRLVNRTLAKEIGISFTPVREAINRLASEGLVEYVRGAGAYVRGMDRQDLAQLYDLRATIEPFAAYQAALHITENELAELRAVCADWRELVDEVRAREDHTATPEQMDRWLDNEERFHGRLIQAARNRWLTKMASDLLFVSYAFSPQRGREQILTLHTASWAWREHAALVRTLQARDAEAARSWMSQHVETGRGNLLAYLDAVAEPRSGEGRDGRAEGA